MSRARGSAFWLMRRVQELYWHRELLLAWSQREIKVRYKQSLLGGAWAILQPLSLMIVFSVIFTHFVKMPSDGIPYPVFSYSALLPWTFFATAISFAVPSLTQNMNLVAKTYFPREILPTAAVLAAFVDFAVASVVFVGLFLFYHMPLTAALLLLPLLLAIQLMLTLGVVLFASAINVFYRDVRFVVPLALQLWMYATPVIYPASLVPERFRAVYMLNPMAGLVEAYRAVALRAEPPDWSSVATAAAISTLSLLAGYLYFKRAEPRFADVI